jgi:hypothetical protein
VLTGSDFALFDQRLLVDRPYSLGKQGTKPAKQPPEIERAGPMGSGSFAVP